MSQFKAYALVRNFKEHATVRTPRMENTFTPKTQDLFRLELKRSLLGHLRFHSFQETLNMCANDDDKVYVEQFAGWNDDKIDDVINHIDSQIATLSKHPTI